MRAIILFITIVFIGSSAATAQDDPLAVFMRANKNKTSLYLIENGKTTINFNGSRMMPLGSAVKTIIAIEFSRQVAAHKINPQKKVPIRALKKFYVPFTDGNAHPNWLNSMKKDLDDSVTLLDVCKGMIRFSSNANTEYLTDLLGVNNINRNIERLGLKQHQPLYYFTGAALMVCFPPHKMDNNTWIATLKAMSDKEYKRKCESAHSRLRTDTNYVKQFEPGRFSFDIQRIWSDRLVASTTEAYASIMQKISSRQFFDAPTQAVLESVMEWPMLFKSNQQQFVHLGAKGGSTAFLLTDALYGTTKSGDHVTCAFFFNDLSPEERKLVNNNFGNLEARILLDAKFRKDLATILQ